MRFLLLLIALMTAQTAYAHGGGLDRLGCHNDRKNGGRHCHNGGDDAPAPRGFISRAVSEIRERPQALVSANRLIARPDELIRTVQKMLSKLGYLNETADGLLGPSTRAALSSFKRDAGLGADEAIDEATIDALIANLERKAE